MKNQKQSHSTATDEATAAGGGTENDSEKTENDENNLIEKETQGPAEGERPKGQNHNRGEGGEDTTHVKVNTDGQTGQPSEAEVQNNLNQKNGGKDTKSTNSKTADQAPTEGKPKQDEPQAAGGRKPEEETDMMIKKTEPSCPPNRETHAQQQTEVQPENNPNGRDREKDTPTIEEDSSTPSVKDEIRKPGQPPAGDVQSDVRKIQEESDKTGPPCQMEQET